MISGDGPPDGEPQTMVFNIPLGEPDDGPPIGGGRMHELRSMKHHIISAMHAACAEDANRLCTGKRRWKMKKCMWRHREEASDRCQMMLHKLHKFKHHMRKMRRHAGAMHSFMGAHSLKDHVRGMLKRFLGGGDARRDEGELEMDATEEPPNARIELQQFSAPVEHESSVNWHMVENIGFGVCGVLVGVIGMAIFVHRALRRNRPSTPAVKYSRVSSQEEEMQIVEGIVVDESALPTSAE
jgi:hypothetical protein